MALGAGLMSLVLCMGCDQQSARAQEVPAKADTKPPVVAAADEPKPAETKPAEPAATPTAPLEAPAVADTKATAAPSPSGASDTNVVQAPVPPSQVKLTPALADVIKLVQAGVGEEVLMSYITNSADIFNIGPNEILYLHDLGVPGSVITSLIQQDSTPGALARKQAANAVQPLPPGVALSKPATNIFTPKGAVVPVANPVSETAEVVTNIPPADAGPEPAVVYTVPAVVQQPVNVSYFYTELSPYGTWIDDPDYGRCWRPTVSVWNSSWRPYCDGGRWLWSDHGWYWYSDYSWGAHTFHYGRWTCPPGRGWVWVPDIHWGPAWVNWRVTSSHCGWAPASPHHHRHHRHHGDRDHDFVFVPKARLAERRLRDSLVSPTHAVTLAKEASPVERAGIAMLPPAMQNRIARVSVRTGEPTVIRNSRRELLANDGRTLTVTPPALVDPAEASPARSASSLSGQRIRSERVSAVTGPQAPATDAAHTLAPRQAPSAASGPTVIPSGRAPIIIRGNGRASGASSATPTVAQPATTQPAVTPDAANNPSANNAAARRAALPGGRRTATETVERPRTAAPSSIVRTPATTPATPAVVPQPSRTPVARSEAPRVVAPATVQRVPSSPAPVQAPRVAPPAAPSPGPVFRAPAPSAPAAVAPRAESYRAPSPAPAPRASAPAQSSGGGSRSSSSRDGNGGGRSSR